MKGVCEKIYATIPGLIPTDATRYCNLLHIGHRGYGRGRRHTGGGAPARLVTAGGTQIEAVKIKLPSPMSSNRHGWQAEADQLKAFKFLKLSSPPSWPGHRHQSDDRS